MEYKYEVVYRENPNKEFPNISFYVCSLVEAKNKTPHGFILYKTKKLKQGKATKTRFELTESRKNVLINEGKFQLDNILAVHLTSRQRKKVLKDGYFTFSIDDF